MTKLSDGLRSVSASPGGETGGLIRRLGLTEWWDDLSASRRGKLRRWSVKSGVSSGVGTPVDQGEGTAATMTAQRLLRTMARWAEGKDEYGVLTAIIDELERRATSPEDYAYLGAALSTLVYHYAHAGPETEFIAACKRHIRIAPHMVTHYRNQGYSPGHTGYLALYDHYRQSGQREKARALCERGKAEWPFIDWKRLIQDLDPT